MPLINELPATSGTYALQLYIPLSIPICVGRLGEFTFPAGEYIYMGSAFNPGGLRARLGRHLRGDGNPHWHIDFLRKVAQIEEYHYVEQTPGENTLDLFPLECQWSQALIASPQTYVLAPGFGASDCRAGCHAHLVAYLDEHQPSSGHWLVDLLSVQSNNYRLNSYLLR